MESELNRNLLQNLSGITGTGYRQAFDTAQQQFNVEQQRGGEQQQRAREYGLAALGRQAELGGVQRGVEQEGLTADRQQFEEERDFPYKQTQYMQSLLQGLPVAAATYSYAQPGALSEILSSAGGVRDLYNIIFGGQGGT
jgi:hypothetical protein